jgi:hypothetical protein
MPVLHLVQIMPSYSRKMIKQDAYQNKYTGSLCSFGNFPGVWSLKADVSELNVGSIVLGEDDGTDIEFRNVGF